VTDAPDWMTPVGAGWTCLSKTEVFDNPWITLTSCDTLAPTGRPAHYGLVHFKNLAIGVLPLFDNGDTLLVGQHRFTTGVYSWEIPEGGGPLGVDPLDSAQRELREETGCLASEWRQVMTYHLSNSVTDEVGYGYLAFGLTAADAEPDETEVIHTRRLPFREALDLGLKGLLPDMITQAMLLRAYHMAQEGELPAALAEAMLRKG
jgi:8-oxo-dGTP pyrophosphatase MutT (NUDIX family)